jgi:hypothetical protein
MLHLIGPHYLNNPDPGIRRWNGVAGLVHQVGEVAQQRGNTSVENKKPAEAGILLGVKR